MTAGFSCAGRRSPSRFGPTTFRRVGERDLGVQSDSAINVDAGEPYYLDLDHAVHLVVEEERVPFVRAYAARMAWPPDLLQAHPLVGGCVELRAVFRAGTHEYCFRVMARLLARLERADE